MDDKLRAIRRRRRRERRRLRRLWNLAPLVLVGLAYLLSAGVVKLMEVPPAKDAAPSVAKSDARTQQLPRLLSAPDTRPELPVMLSTSILDHELNGPPEDALERARRDARPLDSDVPTVELDADDEDNDWSRVPEAGSGLLVGAALLGIGAAGRQCRTRPRYCSTPSSSTSKVSTAPGGITPGTPVSP